MFIIELIYKKPLEEIDRHMKDHVKFLDKYYALGNFIMSGRKIPRTGGIIIAKAKTKKAIEKIIQEDVFYTKELADFSIIQFNASQKASGIADFIT